MGCGAGQSTSRLWPLAVVELEIETRSPMFTSGVRRMRFRVRTQLASTARWPTPAHRKGYASTRSNNYRWLNSVLPLRYVAIGEVGQQGGRDDADDSIEKDVHRDRPARFKLRE